MKTIIAWIGAQNDFRNGALSIRNLQEISRASGEILRLGPGLCNGRKLGPDFWPSCHRRNLDFYGLTNAGLQQNFPGIHQRTFFRQQSLASCQIWLIVY
jgi:hypothetical protein